MPRILCTTVLLLLLCGVCVLGLENAIAHGSDGSVKYHSHAMLLGKRDGRTSSNAVELAKKAAENAQANVMNVENAVRIVSGADEKISAALQRARTACNQGDKLVDEMKKMRTSESSFYTFYTFYKAFENATRSLDAAKEKLREAEKLDALIDGKIKQLQTDVVSAKKSYDSKLTPAVKNLGKKRCLLTGGAVNAVFGSAAEVEQYVQNATNSLRVIIRSVAMAEAAAVEAERRRGIVQAAKESAANATNEYKDPCAKYAGNSSAVSELRNSASVVAEKTTGWLHTSTTFANEAHAKHVVADIAMKWFDDALQNASDAARNLLQTQKTAAQAAYSIVKAAAKATTITNGNMKFYERDLNSKLVALPMCEDISGVKWSLQNIEHIFEMVEPTAEKVLDGLVSVILATANVVRVRDAAESAVSEAMGILRNETIAIVQRAAAAERKTERLLDEAKQHLADVTSAHQATADAATKIGQALKDCAAEDRKRVTELLGGAQSALKEAAQAKNDASVAFESIKEKNGVAAASHAFVKATLNREEAKKKTELAEKAANEADEEGKRVKCAREKAVAAASKAKQCEIEATELVRKSIEANEKREIEKHRADAREANIKAKAWYLWVKIRTEETVDQQEAAEEAVEKINGMIRTLGSKFLLQLEGQLDAAKIARDRARKETEKAYAAQNITKQLHDVVERAAIKTGKAKTSSEAEGYAQEAVAASQAAKQKLEEVLRALQAATKAAQDARLASDEAEQIVHEGGESSDVSEATGSQESSAESEDGFAAAVSHPKRDAANARSPFVGTLLMLASAVLLMASG